MTTQPLENNIPQPPTPTPNTHKTNTNTQPGQPALAQVIIRTTPQNRERWKQAAQKQGISVAELTRRLMDQHATNILDCRHPLNQRYRSPGYEACRICGKRLR
ncbi:MAG: hypothetical protein RL328_549 [Acidobacteriota bacterium]